VSKNLTVGVLVALVLGAMVWLAGPSGIDPTSVGVLILVFSIFFVAMHPKVRAVLQGRATAMRIVGVVAIVIGIAAPVVMISWPGLTLDSGVTVTVAVVSFMGGALLLGLPRMFLRLDAAQAVVAKVKANDLVSPTSVRFSGTDEAAVALRFVTSHLDDFLRIIGPWALLCWAVPFGALAIINAQGKAANLGEAALLLLAIIVAVYVAVAQSAVAWVGVTADTRGPTFGPARVVWGAIWRLWFASSLLAALETFLAPQPIKIVNSLGFGDTRVVEAIVMSLGYSLMGIVFGMRALAFPGIVIGDHLPGVTGSILAARLGRGFQLGVLLTGGPFVVAIWIAQTGIDALHFKTSSPAWAALELVPTLLTFLGVAAFATFLTRGHLAARRLISGV